MVLCITTPFTNRWFDKYFGHLSNTYRPRGLMLICLVSCWIPLLLLVIRRHLVYMCDPDSVPIMVDLTDFIMTVMINLSRTNGNNDGKLSMHSVRPWSSEMSLCGSEHVLIAGILATIALVIIMFHHGNESNSLHAHNKRIIPLPTVKIYAQSIYIIAIHLSSHGQCNAPFNNIYRYWLSESVKYSFVSCKCI